MAIVVDSELFSFIANEVLSLDSNQQRCLFVATLTCRRTGVAVIVATTHLESGACSPADLRAQQLKVILDPNASKKYIFRK